MGVSAVGYVCWLVWYYYRFEVGAYEWREDLFFSEYIPASLSLLLLSAMLTGLFLHLDRLCCCCPCTGVPGEEISVYDPSTDKRFIIKDGDLVEPTEGDV